MNLSRIDLNLFVVFDAIYTQGSLTRAAEVLHVTQPAVSNSLSRLRELLEDPLFVRTPKGMSPTPLAHQLIEQVRTSLGGLENCVQARQKFDPKHSTHTFRVNITEQAELMLLPRLSARLAQLAPEVGLEFSFIDRRETPLEMAAGNIHLSIDAPLLNHPELESRPLISDRYVCVMRRDHPLASGSLSTERFLERRHLHVSSRKRGVGHVDLALKSLGKKRDIAIRLQHYVAVPDILDCTDYLASVPETVARHWPVKKRPLPFETPPLELHLYWHRSVEDDPVNGWLRSVITQQFQRRKSA